MKFQFKCVVVTLLWIKCKLEIEMGGATYLTIYKGRPQMPPKVRRIIFLRKDTFVQPWLIIHFVFWWIEGLVSILHILAALSKHRQKICPKKSHNRSFWCSKNYPPPLCTHKWQKIDPRQNSVLRFANDYLFSSDALSMFRFDMYLK